MAGVVPGGRRRGAGQVTAGQLGQPAGSRRAGRGNRGSGVTPSAAEIAQIHRQVIELAGKRSLTAPSYDVVRAIVRGLPPDLLALAHGTRDAYRDGYELVLRRESARPNDMWQADDTELDVMIIDEKGKEARPWLTAILDDHSRAVPGYAVFLGEPTAVQTALALYQAIWRKADPVWPVCGIPETLYVDHGSDFTSTHISQVAADLQCNSSTPRPGCPVAEGKANGCSARSPPRCYPPCPGTSHTTTAANPSRHRHCRSRSWTGRSASGSSAPTTTVCTRRPGRHR